MRNLTTSSGGSPQKILDLASVCALAGSTCPGRGPPRRGAGADTAGWAVAAGAAVETCKRATGAGATAGGGGALWARIPLATLVPSVPHTGQATAHDMRPLTGSTSKAYRWPHPH